MTNSLPPPTEDAELREQLDNMKVTFQFDRATNVGSNELVTISLPEVTKLLLESLFAQHAQVVANSAKISEQEWFAAELHMLEPKDRIVLEMLPKVMNRIAELTQKPAEEK